MKAHMDTVVSYSNATYPGAICKCQLGDSMIARYYSNREEIQIEGKVTAKITLDMYKFFRNELKSLITLREPLAYALKVIQKVH